MNILSHYSKKRMSTASIKNYMMLHPPPPPVFLCHRLGSVCAVVNGSSFCCTKSDNDLQASSTVFDSLHMANSSLRDLTCSSSVAAAASSFGIVASLTLLAINDGEGKMRTVNEAIRERIQLGEWTVWSTTERLTLLSSAIGRVEVHVSCRSQRMTQKKALLLF